MNPRGKNPQRFTTGRTVTYVTKIFIDCVGYMQLISGSYNVRQANDNDMLIHFEQILFCSSRSPYSYKSMMA